jgi:hypothetical protein
VIARLQQRGIPLVGVTIERWGTVTWTHITVGLFGSVEEAGRYGQSLVSRGIVETYLVETRPGCGDVTRPRTVTHDQQYGSYFLASAINSPARLLLPRSEKRAGVGWDPPSKRSINDPPVSAPGRQRKLILALAPGIDARLIPGPDPVSRALDDLIPDRSRHKGGLWLEGDLSAARARLDWIAGDRNSSVLRVESDGKVTLNAQALLRLSGADRFRAGAELVLADYIRSNEGLYLLTQLISAAHRYCFHVGKRVPTAGGEVPLPGSMNLDNNFDRRINPYRKNGIKTPKECPPTEFDSIIGINPTAVWFNIKANQPVPDGMIAFHELAEALAKVENGLEYLPNGLQPGAHDIAMQREFKVSSQRLGSSAITTAGSNRVFGSEKSYLEFKAESRETRIGR